MSNVKIRELCEIARALAVALDKRPETISGQIFNGHARLEAIEAGSDVGINKCDEYLSKMSKAWPADVTPPLALLRWRQEQEIYNHPEYSYDAQFNKSSVGGVV